MTKHILTQDELKSQIHYNPDTGIFTRVTSTTNCVKVGSIAGTKNKNGYVFFILNKKKYLAHRLAWLYVLGSFPENMIDHINGNKSDNRFCNLRDALNFQNQQNTKLQSKNTSGYKGISWHKPRNRWRVTCSVNKVRYYLGLFKNIEDAKFAYDSFAKLHHGDFYREASHPI